MINFLFFVAAAAVVTLIMWGAMTLLRDREDPLAARLEELQSQAMVAAPRASRRKVGGGKLSGFLYLVSLVPGADDWMRSSERLLHQAGVRRNNALAAYVFITLLWFLGLVTLMMWAESGNPFLSYIIGLVVAGILGFLLPKMVLQRMVKRYRRRLEEALPDTVDLLGIVLGTGLALDQSMLRVSEEMEFIYPELANEFSTVVMQVRAGQERGKAFQQFVRRTGIEDIKSLSAMIVQSEKFGTSLAQALKVYADALRNRRRLRAEAAIGRAGIKMLFPIVIFILPVLFIITIGPGFISVMNNLKLLGGGK
jgi:tight adherence protein C